MLNKIRKGADSFFVRLLFGLIALSFVGIGGVSFMKGNSQGEVITFSRAPSISFEEFMRAKTEEIDSIQRENGINLTDEQIAELGIDNSIMQKLINNAMLSHAAGYYDLDISEDKLIKFVKQSPFFKNDKGEFDLALFKAAFRNSNNREEEYLKNLKDQLLKTTILNIFSDSYNIPEIMADNVVRYMAESRDLQVISIDLKYKPKNWQNTNPDQSALSGFFEANKADFIIPESRNFNYILASSNFLNKKLKLTNQEVKQYYEENKGDFGEKEFSAVKKEVTESLTKTKLADLLAELSKNLEEDVAGGLSLQEIADKYELPIMSGGNLSRQEMDNNSKDEIVQLADSVFEMTEGEISYPIELQDQNEILIVELKSISPARQQNFEEVEQQIKNIWQEKELIAFNLKTLDKIRGGYKSAPLPGSTTKDGVSVVRANLPRSDLISEDKYPIELLSAIFQTDIGEVTGIVRSADRAYFAFIKSARTDSKKAATIKQNSADNISMAIREGLIHELIDHFIKQNNMKIKL